MKFITTNETETALRFHIANEGQKLSFREVFEQWSSDAASRDEYLTFLRSSQFEGYFWEHPGLVRQTLDQPYECILARSQNIDSMRLNPTAFREHFREEESVVVFDNLGRNAVLTVPCPIGEQQSYKHLAAFVRSDKTSQQHALFQALGELIIQEVKPDATRWLSTAGMGVAWLHVRIDQRPKYYRTRMYRDPAYLK